MKTYQYITPETNGVTPIIISAGKKIYADTSGASITYVRDGESTSQELTIGRNTNYEFLKNAKILVTSGKLYLFKDAQETKKVNA
jgi:hypothetical protein